MIDMWLRRGSEFRRGVQEESQVVGLMAWRENARSEFHFNGMYQIGTLKVSSRNVSLSFNKSYAERRV